MQLNMTPPFGKHGLHCYSSILEHDDEDKEHVTPYLPGSTKTPKKEDLIREHDSQHPRCTPVSLNWDSHKQKQNSSVSDMEHCSRSRKDTNSRWFSIIERNAASRYNRLILLARQFVQRAHKDFSVSIHAWDACPADSFNSIPKIVATYHHSPFKINRVDDISNRTRFFYLFKNCTIHTRNKNNQVRPTGHRVTGDPHE